MTINRVAFYNSPFDPEYVNVPDSADPREGSWTYEALLEYLQNFLGEPIMEYDSSSIKNKRFMFNESNSITVCPKYAKGNLSWRKMLTTINYALIETLNEYGDTETYPYFVTNYMFNNAILGNYSITFTLNLDMWVWSYEDICKYSTPVAITQAHRTPYIWEVDEKLEFHPFFAEGGTHPMSADVELEYKVKSVGDEATVLWAVYELDPTITYSVSGGDIGSGKAQLINNTPKCYSRNLCVFAPVSATSPNGDPIGYMFKGVKTAGDFRSGAPTVLIEPVSSYITAYPPLNYSAVVHDSYVEIISPMANSLDFCDVYIDDKLIVSGVYVYDADATGIANTLIYHDDEYTQLTGSVGPEGYARNIEGVYNTISSHVTAAPFAQTYPFRWCTVVTPDGKVWDFKLPYVVRNIRVRTYPRSSGGMYSIIVTIVNAGEETYTSVLYSQENTLGFFETSSQIPTTPDAQLDYLLRAGNQLNVNNEIAKRNARSDIVDSIGDAIVGSLANTAQHLGSSVTNFIRAGGGDVVGAATSQIGVEARTVARGIQIGVNTFRGVRDGIRDYKDVDRRTNALMEDLANTSIATTTSNNGYNSTQFGDAVRFYSHTPTNSNQVQNAVLSVLKYGVKTWNNNYPWFNYCQRFDYIKAVDCQFPQIPDIRMREFAQDIFERGVRKWHLEDVNKGMIGLYDGVINRQLRI